MIFSPEKDDPTEMSNDELDKILDEDTGKNEPNHSSSSGEFSPYQKNFIIALDVFNESRRKNPLAAEEVIKVIRAIITQGVLPTGVKFASTNSNKIERLVCPEKSCGKIFSTPKLEIFRSSIKTKVHLLLAHQLETHPDSNKLLNNPNVLLKVLFGPTERPSGRKRWRKKRR